MKFGLSFLPDASPCTKNPSDYFEEALSLCEMADQAGLSTIKMTEHYLHAYGGYCPSPLMFLSAVASFTKQIRLMTGCILPVFHHPIQIAAETAMLDAISNGRLDVGFARAYLPYEFSAFGINMDESRDRYIDTINAVIRLWTENAVSMTTPFFGFNQADSFPKPIQTPHPPVWGAAVNSRQSFAWLGESGFNLLVTPPLGDFAGLVDKIEVYRESYSRKFPDKKNKEKIAISLPLCIAKNDREAEKNSDIYLQSYIDVWSDAASAWSRCASTDYPGYTGMEKILQDNTPEKMRVGFQAFVGSPHKIIDEVNFLKEKLQVDMILWQIDFGCQPYAVSQQTLDLFVEHVFPCF